MIRYEHTQPGSTILLGIGSISLIAVGLLFVMPDERIAVLPILIVLLITATLFWKLTITIDDEKLRAAFGPGLIRKVVLLAEVESCEPMRVRWWHGWGIHLTGNGWLYNVAGPDAVIVTLRSGKRFCLGTDQPIELVDAIRRFASAR